MKTIKSKSITYLSFKMLFAFEQISEARNVFFYIMGMKNTKQSSSDEFDLFCKSLLRLENGECADFQDFLRPFKEPFSKMKSSERINAVLTLKEYYDDFKNKKRKIK